MNDKELVKRLSKILLNARAEQYTQRLRFERMQNEITELIEILLTGEQQTITALATN